MRPRETVDTTPSCAYASLPLLPAEQHRETEFPQEWLHEHQKDLKFLFTEIIYDLKLMEICSAFGYLKKKKELIRIIYLRNPPR